MSIIIISSELLCYYKIKKDEYFYNVKFHIHQYPAETICKIAIQKALPGETYEKISDVTHSFPSDQDKADFLPSETNALRILQEHLDNESKLNRNEHETAIQSTPPAS